MRHYRKEKLQPGKCKKCGFEYEEHAIATTAEVELLRSLGYAVFICKGIEENSFLTGAWVEIVAANSDGESLKTDELEEMFKEPEPEEPCDVDYMEEISS